MDVETATAGQGSLERGMAGDYELELGALAREAWGRVSGNKALVWKAMLFYFAVVFLLSIVFGLFAGAPPDPQTVQPPSAMQQIGNVVITLVMLPMAAGLCFFGTAIALGHKPVPKSLFSWYDNTLKLVLTYLLMSVLVFVGFLLLVLPGIYLLVSYQLAMPLAVDKKLGPWQALEASRKVIGHNWFKVLGFDIGAIVVTTVSTVLLGIPFIWTVPALLIAYGILYRTLAGIESDTLQRTLANG